MGVKNYEKLRERIIKNLPKERKDHILSVEIMAKEYAKRLDVSEERASIAALLHDMTKAMPNEKAIDFVKRHSNKNYNFKKDSVHAISASVLARVNYQIQDKGIVSAIRYHSIPNSRMSKLEKVIYLADWTEITREGNEAAAIRKIAETDIDSAILFGIELEVMERLRLGKHINSRFISARNNLLQKIKNDRKTTKDETR